MKSFPHPPPPLLLRQYSLSFLARDAEINEFIAVHLPVRLTHFHHRQYLAARGWFPWGPEFDLRVGEENSLQYDSGCNHDTQPEGVLLPGHHNAFL